MKFLKINILLLSLLLSAAIALSGCSEKNDGAGALLALLFLPNPAPAITLPAGATLLGSGVERIDSRSQPYYLLRLDYDGKEPAYAMWIPSPEGGLKPAVVMTNPYDGITWNGDTPPTGTALYSYRTYIEGATIFSINGFGVLHAFGRFYTKGNLQNDVDDMTAGLRFLADSGFADTARLGIYGGSWGGFEALYGAANAPAGAVPSAGVALYPPVDFKEFERYVTVDIPVIADATKESQYVSFYQAYLERMYATPGWDTWTTAALAGKLSTKFLVVHDEWDTLVPVWHSQDLVTRAGGMVEPVWFCQDTSLDLNALPFGWGHGELRQSQMDSSPPPAFTYGILHTFSTVFLIRKLADPGQRIYAGYDLNAINDFIVYIRDYKCSHGKNLSWAAARLRDLADERVLLLEMNTGAWAAGADVVAKAFSDAGWGGASYGTASTVGAALESWLPSCP
ncbi:MAG: prolyl oligopeptidase family serine peptidase [Spirochaetes bacterium]|nr:prolyl oligopeptidase family serine peptidase [Spirochaetota bacterium]